jgi:succinyl-CoA synthetase alpha subunit
MNREVMNAKNVIVQGITGSHGSFHTAQMIDVGTNIVAGTSPGKADLSVAGIPVYNTIADIKKDMPVDATVIFVPAPFAKNALLEAIEARIPLVVCITEGIPIHDMLEVKNRADAAKVVLIGPNCPGVLMPGLRKLGIIPAAMGLPGSMAVVSRSGTLTYEVAAGLTARGIGQKYIIGIGGDRIQGTSFVDCLSLFQNDPDVTAIILIGEIGGTSEQHAAKYIAQNITKPVYAYVAGHEAPAGIPLGHAGAILGSIDESANAKTAALASVGVQTFNSITSLVQSVK